MINICTITYVFLAGTGAGAYLLSACLWLLSARSASVQRLASDFRAGFWLGPLLVFLGSLYLLSDLGNPGIAWKIFFHPFNSVISVGTYLIALFILIGGASAFLMYKGVWRRGPQGRTRAVVVSIVSVFAVGVMSYTGVLFYTLEAVEFWHTALIIVLFIVSSLSSGVALNCAAYAVTHSSQLGFGKMKWRIFEVACVVEIVTFAAFLLERCLALGAFAGVGALDGAGAIGGAGTFAALFEFSYTALALYGGIVGLGIVVPAICVALLQRHLPPAWLVVVLSIASLVVGFCIRYFVLTFPLC